MLFYLKENANYFYCIQTEQLSKNIWKQFRKLIIKKNRKNRSEYNTCLS